MSMFTLALLILWSYIFPASGSSQKTKQFPDNWNDAEYRVLYVVPGASFKHPASIESIEYNLNMLSGNRNVSVACMINFYDDTRPKSTFTTGQNLLWRCETQIFHGAGYGDNIKSVLPAMVRMGGFTHVALILDDVTLDQNFDLHRFIGLMQFNHLAMASPTIFGGSVGQPAHPHEAYRKEATVELLEHSKNKKIQGKLLDVIEVHALFFNLDGWECFWNLINPRINNRGVGYERFVKSTCDLLFKEKYGDPKANTKNKIFRMGWIDTMGAHHRSFLTDSLNKKKREDRHIAYALDSPKLNEEEFDHLTARFIRLLRSPPCRKPVSKPKPKPDGRRQRRRRSLAAAAADAAEIPKACAVNLAVAFDQKNNLPWRDWLTFENLVRNRDPHLSEGIFVQQRGWVKLPPHMMLPNVSTHIPEAFRPIKEEQI